MAIRTLTPVLTVMAQSYQPAFELKILSHKHSFLTIELGRVRKLENTLSLLSAENTNHD